MNNFENEKILKDKIESLEKKMHKAYTALNMNAIEYEKNIQSLEKRIYFLRLENSQLKNLTPQSKKGFIENELREIKIELGKLNKKPENKSYFQEYLGAVTKGRKTEVKLIFAEESNKKLLRKLMELETEINYLKIKLEERP